VGPWTPRVTPGGRPKVEGKPVSRDGEKSDPVVYKRQTITADGSETKTRHIVILILFWTNSAVSKTP